MLCYLTRSKPKETASRQKRQSEASFVVGNLIDDFSSYCRNLSTRLSNLTWQLPLSRSPGPAPAPGQGQAGALLPALRPTRGPFNFFITLLVGGRVQPLASFPGDSSR
jgi:hypothetical protein